MLTRRLEQGKEKVNTRKEEHGKKTKECFPTPEKREEKPLALPVTLLQEGRASLTRRDGGSTV